MARIITASALAFALSLASIGTAAVAEDDKRPAAERSEHNHEGLESIADEVAEVGPEGTEQDGMSRTMDEMIDAESQDGCIGPISGEEGTGCD